MAPLRASTFATRGAVSRQYIAEAYVPPTFRTTTNATNRSTPLSAYAFPLSWPISFRSHLTCRKNVESSHVINSAPNRWCVPVTSALPYTNRQPIACARKPTPSVFEWYPTSSVSNTKNPVVHAMSKRLAEFCAKSGSDHSGDDVSRNAEIPRNKPTQLCTSATIRLAMPYFSSASPTISRPPSTVVSFHFEPFDDDGDARGDVLTNFMSAFANGPRRHTRYRATKVTKLAIVLAACWWLVACAVILSNIFWFVRK
mmetsp:Transcript_9910/g.22415  ORF Transcript_9910/g.22415 Transcript_9910/m.22415 type:complete len:256 (-) Transcript_9910:41-808(-)